MQYYRAYGLVFASEIDLPFEAVAASAPDVTVVRGPIPDDLGPETRGRGLWWARPGTFLVRHPDNSGVLVRDGQEMVVAGNQPDMVRLLLTGSAMSALLQQRGRITLHASSVLIQGRAVGFFGQSGAGKSTTAAVLVARGYPLIADDVLCLHVDGDRQVIATPSFPKIGLWGETSTALDIAVADGDQRMEGVDKFLVAAQRFQPAPVTLSHLFLLEPDIQGNYEVQPLDPTVLHMALAQYVHRKRSAVALGQWPAFFGKFGTIVQQTQAYSLRRPRTGARFDELADTIVGQVAHDLEGAP